MLSLDAVASRESGMRVALPPPAVKAIVIRLSEIHLYVVRLRERERERVEKCAHT